MKKTITLLFAFVLLVSALAGCSGGTNTQTPNFGNTPGTSSQNTQSTQSQQSAVSDSESSAAAASASYQSIFAGTNIVHFPSFLNMEMKSFAMALDGGIISCSDYGYQDDVVKQWVETMYVPVSDYTDSEKTELENAMRAEFADFETLPCCTVGYKMGENYLVITCTFSNVDKAENYTALYNAQIVTENSLISMAETERSMAAQGYVKK